MLGVMLAATAADGQFTVTITQELLVKIAGAVIVGGLFELLRRSWPYIKAHLQSVGRLRRAEKALDDSSPGLWLAPSIPIDRPQQSANLIPIIVVANLKGGVGKTTTVANLIGHYAAKKNKRVLAIDIDFQGSLSAVVLPQERWDDNLEKQHDRSPSKAAQLVDGRDAHWLKDTSEPVDGFDKARCIPSYYTLSIMENKVMVEWLIAKRKNDIRYTLMRTLHDPVIQNRFDIILIDAPPRLTTGCIQALCAATHVLIPTVLDGLSTEASAGFVNQLVVNQSLWPRLKLLGVFGNMTNNMTSSDAGLPLDGSLADYEATACRSLFDTVKEALVPGTPFLRHAENKPVFPIECFIPQKAELGREAGNKIGYRLIGGSIATRQISRAYDRLGDEIDRRI